MRCYSYQNHNLHAWYLDKTVTLKMLSFCYERHAVLVSQYWSDAIQIQEPVLTVTTIVTRHITLVCGTVLCCAVLCCAVQCLVKAEP